LEKNDFKRTDIHLRLFYVASKAGITVSEK
jgi:hypothetical protein